MKDREKVVGQNGVAELLNQLLSCGRDVRLHLIGHSYGCQVLLSAICTPASFPQQVDSLLLLQAAVSAWCFASKVGKTSRQGLYSQAIARVRRPILATYSNRDSALHEYYHLALTRQGDAGEYRAAAAEHVPYYAALGGYGPRGCSAEVCGIQDIRLPTTRLHANSSQRIIALTSHARISGHGDISNLATWWTLYQQVML